MHSFVHGSLQSTGHPLVAHFNNIFAAGCLSMSLQGNMSLCTLSHFGAGLAFDVYGLGCLVQGTVVIVIVRKGLCLMIN